jgi:formamidopyrimidine-DNA glycosylase
MPELPEVESMCRGVAAVVGCTIRAFRQPRVRVQPIEISPSPRVFARRVIGRKIAAVERVGKRVVLVLDTQERIVIEPRMSGLVILTNPPDQGHLRAVFELSGPAKQLLFWDQRGLGVMRLVTPAEFETLYGPKKIGADALQISAAALRERIAASSREIKVALLDQRAVAGIGNIYASEILHRAGIHPQTPCNQLSLSQWKKIHIQTGKVLREAIRRQGSSLRDNTYRVIGGGPGKYSFRVYQRDGEPCRKCRRAEIVRIVQAQRSTFFCPSCQRIGAS